MTGCAVYPANTGVYVSDEAARISPLAALVSRGFSAYLRGFSAIDAYLGRSTLRGLRVLTSADVSDLARLFEDLRYPGAAFADAALDREEGTYYFDCAEERREAGGCQFSGRRYSFKLLAFFQDVKTRRFFDPLGNYPLLRLIFGKPLSSQNGDAPFPGTEPPAWWEENGPGLDRWQALMDGALIAARYGLAPARIGEMTSLFQRFSEGPPPLAEEQRVLLEGLLASPAPGPGFEILKNGGFLEEFWPELVNLDGVDHSKEYHPEGNAWKHTMETFQYRKTIGGGYDLRLSLGLLLHDIGKALANSSGSRRFDGHAELGEAAARRFLERLGFESGLTGDICYLVRNHMLPAALPRLPLIRTGEIMASPLFPTLLELYRCDESSSFKGLDGYYESSAAYRSFLRYRRNPYRSNDGKKLN